MRLLVLSRNAGLYSTSRLVLAARARGHDVTVADPLDFQIVISRGRPAMFLGDRLLPPVDLVLPRIGASITNYGLAVVRQFDMMGIPVLNNAIAIARSRDKLRAMQLLTKKDIDVPKTVCARTPDSVDAALAFIGGTPAIVKLQQGAQGIGTMIAETPQAVTSLLETLWAMGQDIILQEYIAESKGRDYRAICVGGRVVAAMRRQAKKGEFRSNLHRGGLGVRVELPKQYRLAATAAVKVMGLEVAGVDMLEGRDGPKILEINSSPGLEGIERTSGLDVAGAIIAHAEKFLAKRKKRRQRSARDAVVEAEQRTDARAPRGPDVTSDGSEPAASHARRRAAGGDRHLDDRLAPQAKNALDHATLSELIDAVAEAGARPHGARRGPDGRRPHVRLGRRSARAPRQEHAAGRRALQRPRLGPHARDGRAARADRLRAARTGHRRRRRARARVRHARRRPAREDLVQAGAHGRDHGVGNRPPPRLARRRRHRGALALRLARDRRGRGEAHRPRRRGDRERPRSHDRARVGIRHRRGLTTCRRRHEAPPARDGRRLRRDVRALERQLFVDTWSGADHAEAVEAYFERRTAKWEER